MPSEIASQSDPLSRLIAAERPIIRCKTLVIVAHPGDETVACGAALPRMADLTILHVTDGAPRDPTEARRHGFTHWADYARVRRAELERAMAIAGVPAQALKALGVPDQCAALQLTALTRALLGFIAGADLVLTHAYEGGHPDHDAVAFAVAAARGRMRGRGPLVIEMPLYGKATGATARLRLNSEERARKARMVAEFTTQQEMLVGFGIRDETYRRAGAHDFTRLPAAAIYDRYHWAITGRRFIELARAARGELGLDGLRTGG